MDDSSKIAAAIAKRQAARQAEPEPEDAGWINLSKAALLISEQRKSSPGAARVDLLDALRGGVLHARGRYGLPFARLGIPPNAWAQASIDLHECISDLDPPFGRHSTFDLLVSRADLDAWLGEDQRDTPEAEADSFEADDVTCPPIYQTGAPGRPSSMSLVRAEFHRRATEGRALSTLAAEADALVAWLDEHHFYAPRTTIKTVQNKLRDEYRAHFPKAPK